MKNHERNHLSPVTVLFLFTLSMVACSKTTNSPGEKAPEPVSTSVSTKNTDDIVVGEVGSMTGNDASFGQSTHNGIELAVKKINDAGGLLGRKIRVVTMDDQGKPEEAATAVTKLITQDKVVALLGEVASTRSLAMAPLAQQYKVPMVSPSSTNPEVTKKGNYIFRACFIDPFQGFVMARFASETLKLKKVALLKDIKNDYSMGLAQYFKATFLKAGGEIVVEQSFSAGDIDFKAQLTAIKGKSPEAIFVPGYYTEVGLIARQAKEIGLQVPLLGGDGWDSAKLQEIGGAALDGSFFSNHYSPDDKGERVQTFIRDYKNLFGHVPDGMAATGYDAAGLLLDAIKRAGSTESQKLRDALASTKDYPALTGPLTLDADRNPKKSAVIIEIKNKGQFVFKQSLQPE